MILMCIIGGYFTTIYSINSLDQKIIDDAIKHQQKYLSSQM